MKTIVTMITLALLGVGGVGQLFAQVALSGGAPEVVPISPVKVKKTFRYSARFICVNPSPFLASGAYQTDIGIHNPQEDAVSFDKKALVTQTEDVEIGPISSQVHVSLAPDAGIHIDCGHIVTEFFLNVPGASVITGYVVITSPQELDVTAAYTAVFVSSPGT